MGLGCCAKMAQVILIIFNLVVFIGGLGICGVAIALKITGEDTLEWITNILGDTLEWNIVNAAFFVMIGVGVFLVLVGFFGCCGALKRSNCLLCIYILIVCVILFLQVAGGVLAVVFLTFMDSTVEAALKDSIENEYGKSQTVTTSWDNVQFELQCCGGSDYTDYENSFYRSDNGDAVPPSCCTAATREGGEIKLDGDKWTQCKADADTQDLTGTFHTKSCYDGWYDWLQTNTFILIGVMVGFGVVQILVIIFACCVIKSDDSFTE